MNAATPPRLRGADGYVLDAIAVSIDSGQLAVSYAALSALINYSIPTIYAAVNRLEAGGYIKVVRGGPRQPNRYHLTKRGREAVAQCP
jgi:DNA-binding MarR family transcriptional regulator